MDMKVILSVFLILLCGSQAEHRQFYECKFDSGKVLQFSCESPSSLFYSEKCNVVNETRQHFDCDSEHAQKTFTFRQNDFFDVEELYIESLGIRRINVEGDEFRSESTGMFEGILGFGLMKTVTITTLSASGNELRSIPTKISMPSLANLDLSNNKFTRITMDELMGALEVKHLSFAHNQIHALDTKVFASLTQLVRLDLSHNQIRSKNLEHFKNPENLQSLNLSHNSLEYITEETFEGDANLRDINLSNNQINEIDFGSFSTLSHLQHLDLTNNSLKSFDVGAMPELTHLFLEGNYLTSLEHVTPEKYPKLEVLSIARNYFSCEYLDGFLRQWNGNAKLFKDGHEVAPIIGNTDCHNGIIKFVVVPAASSLLPEFSVDRREDSFQSIESENDEENLDNADHHEDHSLDNDHHEVHDLHIDSQQAESREDHDFEMTKDAREAEPVHEEHIVHVASPAKLQTSNVQGSNKGLSSGSVALICVAAAIAVLIIGAVVFLQIRKRQRQSRTQTTSSQGESYDAVETLDTTPA